MTELQSDSLQNSKFVKTDKLRIDKLQYVKVIVDSTVKVTDLKYSEFKMEDNTGFKVTVDRCQSFKLHSNKLRIERDVKSETSK